MLPRTPSNHGAILYGMIGTILAELHNIIAHGFIVPSEAIETIKFTLIFQPFDQ